MNHTIAGQRIFLVYLNSTIWFLPSKFLRRRMRSIHSWWRTRTHLHSTTVFGFFLLSEMRYQLIRVVCHFFVIECIFHFLFIVFLFQCDLIFSAAKIISFICSACSTINRASFFMRCQSKANALHNNNSNNDPLEEWLRSTWTTSFD